ncbi:hypothetical protein ACFPM0_29345 [Pseudonocardia sulfidoxydans]|uniref:hypothetical protein n=1 Tax=Pseudonocardia sulfidoxydans TaxID=54011 RepID=UPI00361E7713
MGGSTNCSAAKMLGRLCPGLPRTGRSRPRASGSVLRYPSTIVPSRTGPSTKFQPCGTTFRDIDPRVSPRAARRTSAHGTPSSVPTSDTTFSAQSSPCGRPVERGVTTGLNSQSRLRSSGPFGSRTQTFSLRPRTSAPTTRHDVTSTTSNLSSTRGA